MPFRPRHYFFIGKHIVHIAGLCGQAFPDTRACPLNARDPAFIDYPSTSHYLLSLLNGPTLVAD